MLPGGTKGKNASNNTTHKCRENLQSRLKRDRARRRGSHGPASCKGHGWGQHNKQVITPVKQRKEPHMKAWTPPSYPTPVHK